MPKVAVEDHRSRVGAERRARMRKTLVESALLVFAKQGVDASVIDDVIKTAEVSRGTFYNYFRTNAELLVAANEELSNELSHAIEMQVGAYPSPTARLIVGIRLYFNIARRFPLFAQFLSRTGSRFMGPANLLHVYLPIHLKEGMEIGEFATMPIPAALDIIVGSGILAVTRISDGDADDAYVDGLLQGVMRGLGVPDRKSRDLIARPLPELDFDEQSLLVRGHRRYVEQRKQKRARRS